MDLGINMDEPRQTSRDVDDAPRSLMGAWWFWVLVVPAGLLLTCLSGSVLVSLTSRPPAVAVGTEAHVADPGHAEACLAADLVAFDGVREALASDDGARLDALIGEGRAFLVPDRTRVAVLPYDEPGAALVRVLDGKHRGRKGLVPADWVVR